MWEHATPLEYVGFSLVIAVVIVTVVIVIVAADLKISLKKAIV